MIRYLVSWIIHISNRIRLTGAEYFGEGAGDLLRDEARSDVHSRFIIVIYPITLFKLYYVCW